MSDKREQSEDQVIYVGSRKVHKLGNSKSVTLPRFDQIVKTMEAIYGPIKKYIIDSRIVINFEGKPVWEFRLSFEVPEHEEASEDEEEKD